MRQRVAFLRTLLSGKPVLCLDEPFAALDAFTREELRSWLAGTLAQEPRTVVLVTHDVEEAAVLADRVLVLSPRPARVVAEIPVTTPAPARRDRPGGRRRAGGRPGGVAVILPLALVLLLLGIWQAYTELGSVDPLILPSPIEVGQSLWEDRGLLLDNLGTTATEVGLGVLCALVAGVGAAIALHRVRLLRRATYPLLIGSQAVPVVTLAPLLVFWLGFGLGPKLAIITLVCFFPVAVTTLDALDRTDPDQLKLMRTLGATRRQAFWWAQMPAALPAALSGARISVAIAVIGAVLAEDSGSSAGLGHLLRQSTGQLETARGYAAVVVLAAFAIALFYTLVLAERRLLPWTHRHEGSV